MAETVRIDPKTHAALRELARAKRLPLTEMLARAVESYRRTELIARYNADMLAMQQEDPKAWQEEQAEIALWDNTSLDGLDNDEWDTKTAKNARREQQPPGRPQAGRGVVRQPRSRRTT